MAIAGFVAIVPAIVGIGNIVVEEAMSTTLVHHIAVVVVDSIDEVAEPTDLDIVVLEAVLEVIRAWISQIVVLDPQCHRFQEVVLWILGDSLSVLLNVEIYPSLTAKYLHNLFFFAARLCRVAMLIIQGFYSPQGFSLL